MFQHAVIEQMRSAVDKELRACVLTHFTSRPLEFRSMIEYQMGWENGNTISTGKRLRPLMLLSAGHALEIEWQTALPAAAAIELIHNFSLVHDDIEDHSETRRGKPTIWAKWGEAQGINLGDAILTLANLELLKLPLNAEMILASTQAMQNAIFSLTQGQYLDLAFEKEAHTSVKDYWQMVAGKTGALFSACFEIAAVLAGKSLNETQRYADLGSQLGLAFQVQDDYLGIWGNDLETGKSTDSDISSRKKTFPVLFALENLPEFRTTWFAREYLLQEDVFQLKQILNNNNIQQVTTAKVNELYQKFMNQFVFLFNEEERRSVLQLIVQDLLSREK